MRRLCIRNCRLKIIIILLSSLTLFIIFLNVQLLLNQKKFSFESSDNGQSSANQHKFDFKSQKTVNFNNTTTSTITNHNYTTVFVTNNSSTKVDRNLTQSNRKIKNLRNLIKKLNLMSAIRNEHFIANYLTKQTTVKTPSSKANVETNSKSTQYSTRNDLNNSGITVPYSVFTTNTPKKNTKNYIAPEFLVIIVQVHSRIDNLRELIRSFAQTKDIEKTLIIFSHDVYDSELNKLIESIDFCAVLQIFYPFSSQLYPREFPGTHPNDCPKNIKKSEALILKCKNAGNPDTFGNYRESNIVQIKHHWTWKIAYVFDHLKVTKDMENLHVLLLEEDYYMMPDAIHVLRKLTEKILSDIDVIVLGNFEKNKQNLDMNSLNYYSKSIWNQNAGVLFSRIHWNMIKQCFTVYCKYDDYNWDWSLQYISQKCFKEPLVAIYPTSSRVIHTGMCGTHFKERNCDPREILNKLKITYEQKKANFFPSNFLLASVNGAIFPIQSSNGGWADPRDHQLCMKFFQASNSFTNLTIPL